MKKPTSLLRHLNIAYAIALSALICLSLLSFASLLRVSINANEVAQTRTTLDHVDAFHIAALEAESAQRGYFLGKSDVFPQKLSLATQRGQAELDQIIALKSTDPNQRRRATALKTKFEKKLAQDRARLAANESSANLSETDAPDIHNSIAEIKLEEQKLLLSLRSNFERSAQQTALIFLAASVLACAIVLIARRSTVRDVISSAATELALRQSEERLRLVSRATRDAVWDHDLTTDELWWNTGVTTLFGHPDGTSPNSNESFERIHPQDRARVQASLEQAKNDPLVTHWNEEYGYSRASGTYATVLNRAFIMRDEKSIAVRMVGSVMDISTRITLEDELILAREEAIEASRLKSQFLANMSHEIRTPMNGVIGMTGLLLDTKLSAQQRDLAETISTSADSLLVILNDILDFSKIEAGKLALDVSDFELRTLLENTIEIAATSAHQKDIEISLEIAPDVPLCIRGDASRLRQILMNLLSNAVKFTDRGEVSIYVSADTSGLRFEVRDTGIGIPKPMQGRLFQAFVQADGSTGRRYGGTGLGLAISRQLIELMDGEIGVESTVGVGSTFWFRAPLAAAQDRLLPRHKGPKFPGSRVLVIDDNQTSLGALERQLSQWGIAGTFCSSPTDALEALSGSTHDLVLLDSSLPGTDCLELASEIRRISPSADIALMASMNSTIGYQLKKVLCDVHDMPPGRASEEFGIQYFLFKPMKQELLLSCLRQSLDPVAPAERSLIDASLHRDSQRRGGLRILIAEDNPVNQRIALAQVSKLGYQVDAVASGAAALEALENGAYDLVLMDCQMPDLDGYEATRELRRREQASGRRTPVIAMTAHAMAGDREKCLAAGMDDHVAKPIKTEALGVKISQWVNGQGAESQKLLAASHTL